MRENVSLEERKKSLRYIILLKEICEGTTTKARRCSDGMSQREYSNNEDTGIPGNLFHEHMDDTLHMLLEGEIAELNRQTVPKHIDKIYIWENKKRRQIHYVQLKTLYGMIQATLRFWKLFLKHHKSRDSKSTITPDVSQTRLSMVSNLDLSGMLMT